jgi:hypothetical protein
MSNKTELSRQPMPPVALISISVARSKPNLPSQMLSGDLSRLRYDEADAVVAVSDQIIVAKEKAWAQRRSDDAEFGKKLVLPTRRRSRATRDPLSWVASLHFRLRRTKRVVSD